MLTGREAAHPAAGSLEASRIEHKPAVVPTGRGRAEGGGGTRKRDARSVPLWPADARFLRGFWKRTGRGVRLGVIRLHRRLAGQRWAGCVPLWALALTVSSEMDCSSSPHGFATRIIGGMAWKHTLVVIILIITLLEVPLRRARGR